VGCRKNLIEAHLPLPPPSARASRPHLVAGRVRLVGRDQQRTVGRVGGLEGTIGGERLFPVIVGGSLAPRACLVEQSDERPSWSRVGAGSSGRKGQVLPAGRRALLRRRLGCGYVNRDRTARRGCRAVPRVFVARFDAAGPGRAVPSTPAALGGASRGFGVGCPLAQALRWHTRHEER